MFAILAIVVVLIFVPFTLEAKKMLNYYKQVLPPSYVFPDFKDFWFTLVVMVILVIIEKLITEIFYSTMYKHCKEKEDE